MRFMGSAPRARLRRVSGAAITVIPLFVLACILLLHGSVGAQGVFERVSLVPGTGYADYFAGTRMAALGHADLAGTRGAEAAWSHPGARFWPRDGAELEFALTTDFAPLLTDDTTTFSGVAAQVQRGSLRTSLATRGYRLHDIPIRTAFDPAGTNTMSLSRREVSVGVAGNLGALLAFRPAWEWSTGLAARWVEVGVVSDDASLLALDLGTTIAWERSSPYSIVGVELAVVGQNVAGSNGDLSGVDVEVPQLLRGGITFTAAMRRGSTDRTWARITVCGAGTHDLRGREDAGGHAGGELEFLDLLALRIGRNDRLYDGTDSFGVGLRHEFRRSVTVALDWAHESADPFYRSIDYDVWGMRAGGSF